jgi:hypothetical protein
MINIEERISIFASYAWIFIENINILRMNMGIEIERMFDKKAFTRKKRQHYGDKR